MGMTFGSGAARCFAVSPLMNVECKKV